MAGIIGGLNCLEPTEMQKTIMIIIYIAGRCPMILYELYIFKKLRGVFGGGGGGGGGVLVNGWSVRPRLYAN